MWCDLGGPGWSRSGPFQAGPCVSTHPRPWEEQTCLRKPPQPGLFPPGTEGHLCSHHS